MNETGLLTIKDVAERLGMKPKSVYSIVHQIPHYRIGRLIRFDPVDLNTWLEHQREAGEQKPQKNAPRRHNTLHADEIVRKAIDETSRSFYNRSENQTGSRASGRR